MIYQLYDLSFYCHLRKQYVCHHSSYHKVDRNSNKIGRSKNTYCKATIKIVIKVDTVSTRKTDPFVKVRKNLFSLTYKLNFKQLGNCIFIFYQL